MDAKASGDSYDVWIEFTQLVWDESSGKLMARLSYCESEFATCHLRHLCSSPFPINTGVTKYLLTLYMAEKFTYFLTPVNRTIGHIFGQTGIEYGVLHT